MKDRKLGLSLGLIIAIIALAACSSPAAAPTDAPDDGDDTATTAPETDAGDGGGDGADASGYDLCDAASEDEVSQIAGVEVVGSTSASTGGILSCNYNAADGGVAGMTLATSDSGVDPQQMFDANLQGEGVEEIPDLGDGAVLTGDENFPILMVMVSGNLSSFTVLAENLDGPGKRDATIELARLSVDRLP